MEEECIGSQGSQGTVVLENDDDDDDDDNNNNVTIQIY